MPLQSIQDTLVLDIYCEIGSDKTQPFLNHVCISDKPVLTVRLGHGIVEDRIIGEYSSIIIVSFVLFH